MTTKPDLIRRQQALAATLEKYRAKPFDWRGGTTCVHMARFHLRKMGHRPEKLPAIRSLLAARRALDARGWADVRAMLASMLPEIPPAAMLPGDLATADGPDGLGGILVCAGPHKLIGWHEDTAEMVVIDYDPAAVTGAFRV
ncbi:DUF6950 family protein [Novosphingobium olei]|uniref:DUF6950 family protein n=1 Tax=Novosphingobium olei TaxID=2728851 RepID=UPI003089C289|nr:C40 family peptidase [Novosphingobium olei]